MSLKDELKRELRNVKNDVAQEIDKTWTLHFKGHDITIKNTLYEEQLLIDGEIVDRRTRKSIWGHLIPYVHLKATFQTEGAKHKIKVKLGGYIKFTCSVKIDGEVMLTEQLTLNLIPWEHKKPILPFLEAQVTQEGTISNFQLPDEEYFYGDDEPRHEPGIADRYVDEIPTPFYVKKLVKLLSRQIVEPTIKTRKATYEHIVNDRIASYLEEYIARFQEANLDEQLVKNELLWLLEHAAHREVVKFVLVTFGLTNCQDEEQKVYVLGLHDEFTPYAAFALKNGASQGNEIIWQLAKHVQGFGTVSAIGALDAPTAEIKYWLLTDGCTGSSNDKFVAYSCAEKGELDVALYEESISKELYRGAGHIIAGMLHEYSISHPDYYTYTNIVFTRFVQHAQQHLETLDDLYPIVLIHQYVQADEDCWQTRFDGQWTYRERADIEKALQSILDNPNWSALTTQALEQQPTGNILAIARHYQLNTVPALFVLLAVEPTNHLYYRELMQTNNEQAIVQLCLFAEQHVNLEQLTTDELLCIEEILMGLEEYEAVGLQIVAAALLSDQLIQHTAIYTLEQWSVISWQHPQVIAGLQYIAKNSKEKDLRERAKALLNKYR